MPALAKDFRLNDCQIQPSMRKNECVSTHVGTGKNPAAFKTNKPSFCCQVSTDPKI